MRLGYKVALPQFRSIVVRAGTPPDVVKKLSDALAKVCGARRNTRSSCEDQYGVADSFEDAITARRRCSSTSSSTT